MNGNLHVVSELQLAIAARIKIIQIIVWMEVATVLDIIKGLSSRWRRLDKPLILSNTPIFP